MKRSRLNFSELTKNLLALILFEFAAQVSYFDTDYVLFRDDDVFLAEKSFFNSQWGWLIHAVTFCQSRFTHIGDTLLFRPGTFFYTWLIDVTIAHDRFLITRISIALLATGIFSLYWVLQRRFGKIFCLAVFLPSVLIDHNSFQILTDQSKAYLIWYHVVPYSFGFPLIVLGAEFIERAKSDRFWLIPAFFSSFLACLFIEFIPGFLGIFSLIYFAVQSFRWIDGQKITWDKPLLIGFVAPLVSFSIIYICVLYISDYPFLSNAPGEKVSFLHSSEFLFVVYFKMIFKVFKLFSSFWAGQVAQFLYWPLWIFSFGTIYCLFRFLRNRLRDNFTLVETAAVGSFSIFMFLQLLRSDAIEHATYHLPTFFMMIGVLFVFILGVASQDLERRARAALNLALLVLVVATHTTDGRLIDRWLLLTNEPRGPSILLRESARFFINNNEYCLGGSELPDNPSSFNQISIVLHEFSCLVRGGQPLILKINHLTDHSHGKVFGQVMRPHEDRVRNRKGVNPVLSQGKPITEIPEMGWSSWRHLVDSQGARNRYQRNLPKGHHTTLPNIRPLSNYDMNLSTIIVDIRAVPSFPILHNIGVSFQTSNSGSQIVLLYGNFVRLLRIENGAVEEHIFSSLQKMSKESSLEISSYNGKCYVLVDDVIKLSSSCASGLGKMAILEFDNNFPLETLKEISIYSQPLESPLGPHIIPIYESLGQ